MKTYEEYCLEVDEKVDPCIHATEFTQEDLSSMKEFGKSIIKKIIDLNNKEYEVEVLKEKETHQLTIEKLIIGHNDFQIYVGENFFSKKILKNILDEWKDKEINNPPIIKSYYNNGFSTALIISYIY